ncbi:kinase-like domain-containing protein [Xylaria arbuscula]|nr:kinase-like domain-containing protein [Xylaria arbuscula]
MADSVEAKTIFEVHSFDSFINIPHHEHLVVSGAKPIYNTDILDDQSASSTLQPDEHATPAPEDVPLRNFLRVTTDHAPRTEKQGFVFGSDKYTCDFLIASDQSGGVSRKHFALLFSMPSGEPTLIFKNYSNNNTGVRSALWPRQKLRKQRVVTVNDREIEITIGELILRIEFPDHDQHCVQWQQRWLAYCREHAQPKPSSDSHKFNSATTFTSNITWRDRYNIQGTLGEGAFGYVHRAQDCCTGQLVAVKEFRKPFQPGYRRETNSEFLTGLSHDSIVKYLEIRGDPPTVIMELLDGDTLKQSHQQSAIKGMELRHTAWLLADALHYLHSNHITHRDLKPDNIMVMTRNPMRVKLIDFGLAINKRDSINTFRMGTPKYWAPELADDERNNKPYTHKVDIWSLGVIMMGLSSRTPPAQDRGWHNILIQRAADNYEGRKGGYMPEAFVHSLLKFDPDERPTALDCLRSEFTVYPYKSTEDDNNTDKPVPRDVPTRPVANLRPAGQNCGMTSISSEDATNLNTEPSSQSTTNLNTEPSCQSTKRPYPGADYDDQSTPHGSATARPRGGPAGQSSEIPSSPTENRSGRSKPENRSSQASTSLYENHKRRYVSPEHLASADLVYCPTPRTVSNLSSPLSPRGLISENNIKERTVVDLDLEECLEIWHEEHGPYGCPTPGGTFYRQMQPATHQNKPGEGSGE